VLNTLGFGGCARDSHFACTVGVDFTVISHEFGHFFGGLQDEYQCNTPGPRCLGAYTGAEPPEVNQTAVTTRGSIKWRQWIPPFRPVPTLAAHIRDQTEDVGIFAGGTRGNMQWWNGLYRPSLEGRMRGNVPPHNPVGYEKMRDTARPRQEADLRRTITGDFNGDGKMDVVQQDGFQISLFLAGQRNLGMPDPQPHLEPHRPPRRSGWLA
jgi:hypothetical protein